MSPSDSTSPPSKVQAWLATARTANIPSVISNVWLGVALGAWVHGAGDTATLLKQGAIVALAGVLLYIGGNFLNDWHDREWDEKHRPERALPSGVFPPLSYLWRAIRFMGLGAVCAALVGESSMIAALTIIVLIVIYTHWHKKAVWTVVPMGLCRALLPVMGYLTVAGHNPDSSPFPNDAAMILLLHAAGLFCYIVGLSLTARYESIPTPPPIPKALARIAVFLPLPLIGSVWWDVAPLQTAVGMVPFLAWTIPLLLRRHSVPVMVSGFLAGIPLVDLIASFPLAVALLPVGATLGLDQPLAINTLILPALAFMAGRRLQTITPAT